MLTKRVGRRSARRRVPSARLANPRAEMSGSPVAGSPTVEEDGELSRVGLARPPEHPAAPSEPGGIGVVGDGAALRRGKLDEGARTEPVDDRAPAFQILDDAPADHRGQPAVGRAEDCDRENHRRDGKNGALRTRCKGSAKGARRRRCRPKAGTSKGVLPGLVVRHLAPCSNRVEMKGLHYRSVAADW